MNAALLNDCDHFMPEEAPGVVVKHILGMTARTMRGKNDGYTDPFKAESGDPG
jgi:hypothetical protein